MRKTITITIRKSAMNGEGEYDLKKLQYPKERLLSCTIEEQKEAIEVTYDISGCYPFSEIKRLGRPDKLRILLDAAKLYVLREEYSFEINPENLYFDKNFRVFVKNRDVYKRGESQSTDFLQDYKALSGYVLQHKYSYEDYREGGFDLLKKNKFLKEVLPMESLLEVTEYLDNNYEAVTADIADHKMLVNKSAYKGKIIYIILSFILLTAAAGYTGYYCLLERPQMTAKLQAEVDYLKGDYIKVIDDLTTLTMKNLSYDQKYILSVSFVKTENLTLEQKQNILEKLPVNGDEKLMEYWIHIGRLNPLEAENIAMQKSDDELLLYAYMKEKDLVQTDTQITGEEKSSKLEELEGKISKLSEKYMKED